ncbi:TPA: hypothetical protein KE812_002650 [Enterobacter cloacae]|nr:hypothetical protein [Enterobacter cloacae]
MAELTKEWLLTTIAELEEERDATPGAVNEDAAMALAAMKIALASLEAEPGRNPVLAYADNYRDMAKHGVESIPVWSVITDLERNIAPLYIAHPAPVSVPAAMEMDDDFDSAFEHGKAVGWNACRSAMLKHSESFIVTSDHRMMEMPQVEAINAVTAMIQGVVYAETPTTMQTAPALDSSPKIAELPSGNSPVIPDGWVMVPEDPTHEMLEAGDEQFGTYDVYRRMIEAAPKLE